MERLIKDLRFALRRLRKSPGFTLIAVASLALGIGANTAIFSLVQAVLLRSTPVQEPDRVLEVYLNNPDFPYAPFSIPDFRDLQRATPTVFARSFGSQLTLVPRDLGDHVESLAVEMVTGDYFTTLGLKPFAGRLLSSADDVSPGAHPVAVLSWDYWSRAFNRDRSAIGQSVRINGRNFTIVGVAPREYSGNLRGIAPALFVPIMMINQLQPSGYDQLQSRGDHSTFVRARLQPGVTISQADAVLQAYLADMKTRYRNDWPQDAKLQTISLANLIVNPAMDKLVVLSASLLTVVVGLVLLIACANLASFLLAQARDRQREIAIRLAIGAERHGLIRQLLTESVALALVSGAVALALAKGILWLILNADMPLPIPITVAATLNPVVLLFAFGVSIVAGIMFGLVPALQATRTDVVGTIKNENTGGGPARYFTLRNTLVVGQVAVSLVLLVTAGLFLRSLTARQLVKPGFGDAPTAILQFAPSAERYNPDESRLFVKRLEERVGQIPGVNATGITGNLHLNPFNTQNMGVNVDGVEPPKGTRGFTIDRTRVDPGFFAAAGVRILRGRNFNDLTDREGGTHVAIINEVMAERFWWGQDALGKQFHGDSIAYTVIGVTRNTKVRSLGEQPRMFAYTPLSQGNTYNLTLLARTSGDAERLVPQVLAAARELDPDLVVFDAKTMERHLAVMLLPARLAATVFAAFAGLALILALIGVYGVVSYTVARRTREVGIRMSLGARPFEVVRLLMRDGFGLVGIGAVLGIVIALLTARVLRTVLFGIEPVDPVTFTAGPALLLAVGALAAWIPANRASRVDPARVLKGD
jgi:putative ABC transport system permease protein